VEHFLGKEQGVHFLTGIFLQNAGDGFIDQRIHSLMRRTEEQLTKLGYEHFQETPFQLGLQYSCNY